MFGGATALSGSFAAASGAPIAGAALELQASRFPFRRFTDVAHATTAADGSFSFPPIRPDRNTRYRAVDAAQPALTSRPLTVLVDVRAIQHVYRRPDGEAMVTLLSYHPRDLRWGGRRVFWFAAPAGSSSFQLVAVTRTHEVRAGVTYATATFFSPAPRFDYRVCFNPPLERAFGAAPHAPCPTQGFVLAPGHRG